MSDQRERVNLLSQRLLSVEAGRRQAARDKNNKLHSDLLNMNREIIGDIPLHDLRSLVTRWLLDQVRVTEKAEQDRRDAYAEGYKQGQLDARMDALNPEEAP